MRTFAGLSFVLAAWAVVGQTGFAQFPQSYGTAWGVPQPPQPYAQPYNPQPNGDANRPWGSAMTNPFAVPGGMPRAYPVLGSPAGQSTKLAITPIDAPARQESVPTAPPPTPNGPPIPAANTRSDDAGKPTAEVPVKLPPLDNYHCEHCWGDDNGCGFAAHNHTGNDEPCFSQHHHGFFGEILFLRPFDSADVVFARTTQGCGFGTPVGGQGITQPNFAPGVRIGGDWALNCYSSIEASFTWFEVSTHAGIVGFGPGVVNQTTVTQTTLLPPLSASQAFVVDPPPPGNFIQSAVTLPQTMNCASDSQAAFAGEHIGFRFGDVVYKHLLWGDCCHYAVNFFAGGRYAHLDQDFDATFLILGATDVNIRINFDGFGPRLGLDASMVGKRGFLVYTTGSASFVAGRFGASFIQQNVFVGNQGFIDFHDERIVPILELEAGLGWINSCGSFRVTAGYSIAGWFNTLTTADFINAVQTNNFTTNGGNLRDVLTFGGLVAHAEFRF